MNREADFVGMGRFVAFSAAVFAFGITLLAIDIRLPLRPHYSDLRLFDSVR